MSILFVVLSLLWPSVPTSQTPQTTPKGTGRIAGTVTAGDTGRPLAFATMHLIRWEGGLGAQSYARADAQGQFEFTELRPGSYQLTAAAERYLTLDFGQKLPTEPSRRIELADAQRFTADFTLPRTAAIEGRIVDEFGDPVPGVSIQIARVLVAAGKRRLAPVSGGPLAVRPTDDLGQFRVFNLPPGDYYVLTLSGPFAGADDPSGFAPTYYPGTRVPTQAQSVHVDSGQDIREISFALTPSPMATISGVVQDAAGQAVPGANLMLFQTTGGDIRAIVMARIVADADGAFTYRNVAPGSYAIQAYGRSPTGALARAPFGSLALDVPDGGRSDLIIRVGGSSARGHISFEGPATPPQPGVVYVFPQQADFINAPAGGGPPQSVTHDDWTFEVNNMSGPRYIRVTVGAASWVLKRVVLNGRDITDEPVDFRKGDVDGLEITLTSNVTALTGTVTDNNALATGYGVLVFSDDQTKWTFPSRFIAVGAATQQGSFSVRGLPPGSYHVIALPANEINDAQEPETLTALAPLSTGVLLAEGGAQTVTLKLVRR